MTRHRPAAAGLSAVLALALAPLAHAAAAPEGLWGVEGSRTVFRLAPCGGSICATLERSGKLIRDPDLRDVNNADASLRTRRLQGIEIMQDVRAAGPDAWRGRIYAPGMGRSFPVDIRRVAADTLTARSCAGPLLCRTDTLKRLP